MHTQLLSFESTYRSGNRQYRRSSQEAYIVLFRWFRLWSTVHYLV